MSVITRFAPSPTGYLHLGGARTALFNWLYARHHGGQFRLRIEDTDRKRSTNEAIDQIIEGMRWLGLDWDGDIVYQFAGVARHAEIARQLLENGGAYHCYCSPDELTVMRERARAEGRPVRYDGTWRDRDPADAPAGVPPVIRFKAPREGETIVEDGVQGPVRVGNEQLDDMVLMRADGTPTYMLSVVVDDHDMGITHAIRGDDHLTNAVRQTQLFMALGWTPPVFAHIPLIHGADGAKLSKRHGAVAVGEYQQMGVLPEAMRNYLLRLGWGHGDEEIISTDQAVEWFDLGGVGKSPARFDSDKLLNLNGHYIRSANDERLVDMCLPGIASAIGRQPGKQQIEQFRALIPELKPRAKTLLELIESSIFLFAARPLKPNEKAAKILTDDARALLARLNTKLSTTDWARDALETAVREFAEREDLKLGKVAQPLRAALTGSNVSPGIFDVMAVLGKEDSLGRIQETCDSENV